MESQDIQKATTDTSTSRNTNDTNDDEEIVEEMDPRTAMMEDDHGQLVEEEASSSALPGDADSEELAQTEEFETDSVTFSSNHRRAKKGGVHIHVARRQRTSGRSLNK